MFRNKQLAGWQLFMAVLIKRFRIKDMEASKGKLVKLQHTTTISKYQKRFEAVTNETMYLPPLFMVHCFISGLRSNIKNAVLVSRPTELDEAISLALLHEHRIALVKEEFQPTLSKAPGLLPAPKTLASVYSIAAPVSNATIPRGGKFPIRRLSPIEAQQKRAQVLCSHCDEKYTWNHKC